MRRWQAIINVLYEQADWCTGDKLAQFVQVTTRTIRSDIKEINERYGELIASHKRLGYRLKTLQKYHLITLDEQMGERTSEYRLIYLFRKVFNGDCYLEPLRQELFISQSTLALDIVKLQRIVEQYDGLCLVKQKGQLLLQGPEYIKRKLYKKILSQEFSSPFMDRSQIIQLYSNIDMAQVITAFEQVLKEEHYTIRQTAEAMLFIHIGILIEQLLHEHYLPPTFTLEKDQLFKELTIARRFFSELTHIVPTVPDEELLYFSYLLAGYQAEISLADDIVLGDESISINQLVQDVLSDARQYSGIDFSKSSDCVNGLHLHLQGLITRINHRVYLPNPLLRDIKQHYPLIFDVAVFVTKRLEQRLRTALSEDEIAFLSLHLGVAYSQLLQQKLYQVVIVGVMNSSQKVLIQQKIISSFFDRVSIIACVPTWTDDLLETYTIDFIVSVGPLTKALPIPIIHITGLFNQQDERYVFDVIQRLDRQELLTSFALQIENYLTDCLFFTGLQVQSVDDILSVMAEKMVEQSFVSDKFLTSTLQREQMSATSFQYGIAIPHPLEECSYHSVIAVGILDKPIVWGGFPVRLVLMLALKDEERDFLPLLFEWLGNCMLEEVQMTELLSAQNCQQFIQYIIS